MAHIENGPARAAYARASAFGRVALTGWDGDALLAADFQAHWGGRLRRRELGELGREVAWHVRRGKVPRIGVRAALRRMGCRRGSSAFTGYPTWLAPSFERRLDLRDRWREYFGPIARVASPRAPSYALLTSPQWRTVLDPADPGMSGVTVEQRHPLLDLRVVHFALSLPSVPWCLAKELFRASMRGRLPDAIVDRPKTPLAGDRITAGLSRVRLPEADDFTSELAHYVDVPRYRSRLADLRMAGGGGAWLASSAYTTFALNGWLASPVRGSPALAPLAQR